MLPTSCKHLPSLLWHIVPKMFSSCNHLEACYRNLMSKKKPEPLTAREVLTIALASETDPRTVLRFLRGEPVRGLSADRIKREMEKRGSTVRRES